MNINSFYQYLPENLFLQSISIFSILLILVIISYWVTKFIIINTITKMFRKTATKLDDVLLAHNVLNGFAYIVPSLIIYNLSSFLPYWSMLFQRLSLSLMVLSGLLVLNSLISALGDLYSNTRLSDRLNIKSYLQIIKLIINIVATIIVISILIDKSPSLLLSGIGAMTAILMLIFKDTILSFIATIQITSNDLFKVGDWIEAPQFGADGDVKDIALHVVKIQNWDKTISIIPTHQLIDSAFKNWRGMTESGGRRIKRSIYIDMNSIKFCDKIMLDNFKKFNLLKNYIELKNNEISDYNIKNNIDDTSLVNGRHLTNIGTFRAYIEAYLKNHNEIHDKLTFLIRQLDPTEFGLPIQIYVFTNDTDWIRYENIQSNIFDHILAVIPEFNLQIFQNPTGKDFLKINDRI